MPKEGQVCHSFLWGIVAKDEKFLNQATPYIPAKK
jgi:hypothetical protein